jgi:outer membrane murein-binding lipoprotein Lpp
MSGVPERNRDAWAKTLRAAVVLLAPLLLAGCVVAAVVDAGATVAATAVKTTAKVAGAVVGAVIPSGDSDKKKKDEAAAKSGDPKP